MCKHIPYMNELILLFECTAWLKSGHFDPVIFPTRLTVFRLSEKFREVSRVAAMF